MINMSMIEVKAAIFKALGHPTRVKIVDILATEGSKCVCELVERLGFDQSTISKHLGVLKSAGIVSCAKEGLMMRYEMRMTCAHNFMQCVERIETGAEGRILCSSPCVMPCNRDTQQSGIWGE